MHLIITDIRMARSRVLHVGWWHALAVMGVLLALGASLTWLALRTVGGPEGAAGGMTAIWPTPDRLLERQELAARAGIDAMARKVGEMQARLMQLESLDERVRGLVGLPAMKWEPRPGQGGALLDDRPLSRQEFEGLLGDLGKRLDARHDRMLTIESRLVDQQARTRLVPSSLPVAGHPVGSAFGTRIDPINGHAARHTGLDFPAPTGTAIVAAAGGVVVTQEFHREYGNMIEVSHGNGLITRYAHASKVFVKKGDLVRQGQKIAAVGATGRVTGPHLHFEVLKDGVWQNPGDFLFAGRGKAPVRMVAAREHVVEATSPQQ